MNRFIVALSSVFIFSLSAFADLVVYDSAGFEAPAFTAGSSVIGQNDWAQFGGTPPAFAVETSKVASGSQAVQGNGGPTAGVSYAVPDFFYVPESNELIHIQIDLARTLSSPMSNSSALYGVEIFDENSDRTSRFGLQLPAGGTAIRDFVTVPVPVEVNPTGNQSSYYGDNVAENTFQHFDFVLDYATKTVSLTVDGNRLASQIPFVTGTSTVVGGVGLQIGSTAVSADNGYFDNFLVTAQLKGDYNHDDKVDMADYVAWRNAPSATDPFAADGNGDGLINSGDYDAWRSNFGNTRVVATGSGLAGGAAVPEPGSMLLVVVGFGAAWVGRRR